jgi:hypothetical protein
VDGRRFRMLFEIDGVGPHEEDSWIGHEVQIGHAVVADRGCGPVRSNEVRSGHRHL